MPELKNPQHEKFCQEYHLSFNGTQSAIEAGYSEKTARTQASQLLTKLNIQDRLKELQEESKKKYGVSVQDLVDRLNFLYKEGIKENPIVSGGEVVGYKREDMNISIKSIDGLAKIIGANAPTKTDNKTTLEIQNPQEALNKLNNSLENL